MVAIVYEERHAFPDGVTPHSGNPAGVCLLEEALADGDLQGLAQSNNLSETAYLLATGEPDRWSLRWFTPGCEVDLCGHATLAAAATLFDSGAVRGETARFDTASGELRVTQREDGQLVMDFPEVACEPANPDPGAVAALGAAPEQAFEVEQIHGSRYQMFVYPDEAIVAGLQPEFGALKRTGVNVVVTAPGVHSDFVSRFFCPDAGIDEDPVTGSAHCTLAPYWARRLEKSAMTARQIGPRAGALSVQSDGQGRVRLIGQAKAYLKGTIQL
jgi:PhzF family phenazine biosynthesis protein